MGKAIEAIAVERGHTIVGKVDNETEREAFVTALKPDVAIEFSMPESAIENIKYSIDQNSPIVCGTTGWLTNKQEVEDHCRKKNGTLFYTSNFAQGRPAHAASACQGPILVNTQAYPACDPACDTIEP